MEATIIIMIILLFIELWKVKYRVFPAELLSYNCTNILRGICCVPVIFCHFYEPYNNICQINIGRFAYIAVTLFFMFSSYGLEVSAKMKADYLDCFFVKRFSVILVPYILSIIIKLIFRVKLTYAGATFVHVLLVYYIIFYFAHTKIRDVKKRECILVFCTLCYSIGGFFLGYMFRLPKIGLNWYPESLGLSIGIIIAYHYDKINRFFKTKVLVKLIVCTLIAVFLKVTFDNYISVYYIYQYRFLCDYIYRMAAAISVIAVIMLLFAHIDFGNRISHYLGRISFEVFLYQGFYLQFLLKLPVEWNGNLYISMVFVCTFITALVMNKAAHLITALIKNV